MKIIKTPIMLIALSFLGTSCEKEEVEPVTENPVELCNSDPQQVYLNEITPHNAEVYTDIIIDATPEQVWEVLTDYATMPSWSTTLQGISGDVSNGGSATVHFLNAGAVVDIDHTLIYEEGLMFGWSEETSSAPGIYDHHIYRVEACGSQTRFVQSDQFIGESTSLSPFELAGFVLGFYTTFNEELKAEVETRF